MIDFTYEFLNFPPIPKNLLEEINCLSLQFDNYKLNQHYTVTKNNQPMEPARYARYDLSENLTQWIKQNVRSDFYNCGYVETYGSAQHLPHVDVTGDYKINYVIDPGGPNVITRFYCTPEGLEKGYRPAKYEDLVELDEFCAPAGSWVKLNTRLIHGVDNLINKRNMITLTFFNVNAV